MYFKIYFIINHLFCLFIIFIFAGTLTVSKLIINIKKNKAFACRNCFIFIFHVQFFLI